MECRCVLEFPFVFLERFMYLNSFSVFFVLDTWWNLNCRKESLSAKPCRKPRLRHQDIAKASIITLISTKLLLAMVAMAKITIAGNPAGRPGRRLISTLS